MKVIIQTKDGSYKIIDLNRRKAIRERCLNCSGWILSEVRNCEFPECSLHPFRSGNGKQDAKARVKAIRAYCLWCCLGNHTEVIRCEVKHCPLFAFRKAKIDRSGAIDFMSKKDLIEVLSEYITWQHIAGYGKNFYCQKKASIWRKLMVKNKKGGTYIKRELYQSEVFNSLNKIALRVLIAFLDKRMRERKSVAKDKKGTPRPPEFVNLDRITLTYGELEKKYWIKPQSATRAIDELLAKGFIEIKHQGGAYNHDKSVYALVDKWMLWKKDSEPFSVRRKDPVRRGYQGKKNNSQIEFDSSLKNLLSNKSKSSEGELKLPVYN
jgi:hypothetical protein